VGRWAKVNLDAISPWDQTLFLDADTRVYDKLDIGFKLLDLGWDLVIVPSIPQGGDLLGHCSEAERQASIWETSNGRDVVRQVAADQDALSGMALAVAALEG